MNPQNKIQNHWDESWLEGENADYLESLYEQYLEAPQRLSEKWRRYFANLDQANEQTNNQTIPQNENINHSLVRKQFCVNGLFQARDSTGYISPEILEDERHQVNLLALIESFRFSGHLSAHTNPLQSVKDVIPREDLSLQHHELQQVDPNKLFHLGTFNLQQQPSLKNIVQALQQTYTGSLGIEYMHMMSLEEKAWIQRRLEFCQSSAVFSAENKQRILRKLIAAEDFEQYLHKRYIGQKRFSLEGGESLIPLLDELIQKGGENGVQKMVFGMAHRGRLNVLTNIMGKPTNQLFNEFAGIHADNTHMGDVKYHKGYSTQVKTAGESLHLVLAFNPSHLEIVGPVIAGSVRAGQTRRNDIKGDKTVAVVLHGDAAFAGQGVVMETFNMAQTRGFGIKGTIHIVINNQIGFTTSTIEDSRSSYYATDVAKIVNAPILHVNGDDPEAVILAARVALEYRLRFSKDVVIDLVCYRRHGHNEADEPSVTQPVMYRTINNLLTTQQKYTQTLIQQGVVTEEWVDYEHQYYRSRLDKGEAVLDEIDRHPPHIPSRVSWSKYRDTHWYQKVDTTLELSTVQQLAKQLLQLPSDFKINDRVSKIWQQRQQMLEGQKKVDWGFAENLAYASLLKQGYGLRLSGQDSGRGTFFHRHAVVHHQQQPQAYIPLQHISAQQGHCEIIDSLLSEAAVLAFEYGYAMTDPNTLVIWEAQFGDFANGAQVVIDQFISAGEQKWSRLCGLVMFLPHGLEGMGAEHSSARLERFMQLTAQDNFQVCIPSTPAQIYHLLRRQMLRLYRKPLVVMTPKSLLRHPEASNHLGDFVKGTFQVVIDDHHIDKEQAQRLILCSGKVYYDLIAMRQKLNLNSVAIVRLEQLYPFPKQHLVDIFELYPHVDELIWCQEEARNQGAWDSIKHRFGAYDYLHIACVSRSTAAAPAVGVYQVHQAEQHDLLKRALCESIQKNRKEWGVK
jgi:2-oxoglutarate dehydrogenase E1 component